MKYFALALFFTLSFTTKIMSQDSKDPLELSTEVYNAYHELTESLEHLSTVHGALADIAEHKAPIFTENGWRDLAKDYESAAKEVANAPLPTSFDKEKYVVSLADLQNCTLKDSNLKKLNGYLQELKDAQERGEKSIIELNAFDRKIKLSQEILRYCITTYQKFSAAPIFGEIFQWNWLELDNDVSASLGKLQSAVTNQRKRIKEEKLKIDLYVSNLENNLALMTGYLEKNCALKLPNQQAGDKAGIGTSDKEVENGFYIFLTADLVISDKRTTIISAPFLRTGNLTDAMIDAKDDFIKQINLQLRSKPEDFKQTLTANDYQAITRHYAKPYSLVLLKSEKAGYDAIEAFKASIRTAVQGLSYANTIAFFQLNP